MDGSVRIEGLEDAIKTMQAAFPADPEVQRKILNGAMRRSATQTMLAQIKARAAESDRSGALSESIGIRNRSRRSIKTARTIGALEITPIRSNLKAMAMYINYYYTAKGKTPPAGIILSGIRHGHLVEFGSINNTPRSFLWDPARANMAPYMQRLAIEMRHQIASNVRRASKGNIRRKGRVR